jgi:8-oxo-dGTP diphosphatase
MIFHYLVRGIICLNGRVLLAHQRGADNTFLPGGHIELGESAQVALQREIEEEVGEVATVKRFIGAVECTWVANGQANHEINLVFEVEIQDLDPAKPPTAREPHLEFIWVDPAKLVSHNLQPHPLVECLATLGRGYRGFWGSAIEIP